MPEDSKNGSIWLKLGLLGGIVALLVVVGTAVNRHDSAVARIERNEYCIQDITQTLSEANRDRRSLQEGIHRIELLVIQLASKSGISIPK